MRNTILHSTAAEKNVSQIDFDFCLPDLFKNASKGALDITSKLVSFECSRQ